MLPVGERRCHAILEAMTASDRSLPNVRSTSESPSARTKGPGGRIPNSLLALGSAAVMTIYSAGYLLTKSAADRFAAEDGGRRRPAPPASPTSLGHPELSASVIADSALAKPATSTNVGAKRASQYAAATAPTKSAVSTAAINVHATDAATAASADSAPATTDSVKSAATSAPVSAPAPAPAPTPTPTPAPVAAAAAVIAPKMQLHDGTYTGYGTSRHGDIEATVVIEGGRIATAAISRCLTRYSCSWVAHLQQQVVTRQSPEVDYVSGATESTNAFYYAVVEALTKAK